MRVTSIQTYGGSAVYLLIRWPSTVSQNSAKPPKRKFPLAKVTNPPMVTEKVSEMSGSCPKISNGPYPVAS